MITKVGLRFPESLFSWIVTCGEFNHANRENHEGADAYRRHKYIYAGADVEFNYGSSLCETTHIHNLFTYE